jgi:transposase
MTYPLKFRQKVFAVKEKYSLTYEQAREHFDLPIRTLFRWQNKLEPCLTRNKPATKIDMDALKEDVELYPDDYQWERAKRFNVYQSTIGVALKHLGFSNKKNTKAPQSQRRATR